MPRVGTTTSSSTRWAHRVPWLGAALGLLWFLAVGGGPALNPTNLDWAGQGDLAAHVLGWLHFRDAPWGLPLGRAPSLMHPLTMTVALSDSNPWVALALKPFSGWLPRDFQYIGPWLAVCFALQGWMGARLMALLTPRAAQQLLGAALFVLAPVLLQRALLGHDTLCAQWMILALFWLNLRPREDARAAWRAVGWALALTVLAAGIHPYLVAMLFPLTLALLFTVARVERHLSWRQAGAALAGAGLAVGAVFAALGYIGQGVRSGAAGFGHYSANLLTLVNPDGWSRLLPALPSGPGQYEGFGYLGTGALGLAVVLLWSPSGWWPRAKAEVRARLPLVLMVLALAVLAFSSVVMVAGWTALSLRKLTAPLLPVLETFRSSGRFIWPLHYAVLLGLIAAAVWRWRQRPAVATGVLLGAVLLQFLDTAVLWQRASFPGASWPRLQAREWESVDPFYRHIALYPPQIVGSGVRCVRNTFPADAYAFFADLAYRRGMTTNSGYAARLNEEEVLAACHSLRAEVENGRLAEDTLYIADAAERARFQHLGPRVTCGMLDGYTVCVAAKEGRFREALLSGAPAPAP